MTFFNKNYFLFILLLFFLISGIFFITLNLTRAQTSGDAIAIRVIPNLEHYSAERWYKEKEFQGSPQSLLVDGYEAVRDGRTVYVNVANVRDSDLWTNIYLISYNQQAERDTLDIFGHIISQWKFNTNYTNIGVCRGDLTISCFTDDDCPPKDFCSSSKARVTRDTRRLSDIAEIKFIAEENKIDSHYPRLTAGTYLPNMSVSVWPSWQETLGDALGAYMPVDPINKLGYCGDVTYDPITCWDEDNKRFGNTVLPTLPGNSYAYVYMTDEYGSTMEICAVMESGLNITGASICAITDTCADADGDGFCRPACLPFCPLDCDDNDANIGGPPSAEVCGGGLDEDCDGFADCYDIADCGSDPFCVLGYTCPNNSCEDLLGEDCNNCPEDCGACPPPTCGNSVCDDPSECSFGTNPCPSECFCGNGVVDCGEQCDDGCLAGIPNVCESVDDFDGCDSDCTIGIACVDIDDDGHDTCDTALDGNPVDCNDNPLECGDNCFFGNPMGDICDEYDNNCNGIYNEGWDEETCGWVCLSPPPVGTGSVSYNYNNLRDPLGTGQLMCCGDDDGEDSPYESPEINCDDGRDNDCNGYTDNLVPPLGPDPNCAGTCFGTNLGENFWYVWDQDPDCNQCDHDGDDEGDQFSGASDPWLAAGLGREADMCDTDCISYGAVVVSTVHFNDFQNTESRCNDLIDNDCDSLIDCGDPDCLTIPPCLATCADGTEVNTCVVGSAPRYCDSTANLVDSCGSPGNCDCSNGWLCGPLNTFCCDNECNGICQSPGCDAAGDPDCGTGLCCGNGTQDPGEECDDGNTLPNDGCAPDCTDECDGVCNGTCSNAVCTSLQDEDCPAGNPCCGNGTCDGTDTFANCPGDCPCDFICDGTCMGAWCSDTEDPDCSAAGCCGNGVQDPGEECDDGDDDNSDECRNDCTLPCIPTTPLCDTVCPPACAGQPDIDPDCGCLDNDECCAPGCTNILEPNDCAVCCDFTFPFPCVFCP